MAAPPFTLTVRPSKLEQPQPRTSILVRRQMASLVLKLPEEAVNVTGLAQGVEPPPLLLELLELEELELDPPELELELEELQELLELEPPELLLEELELLEELPPLLLELLELLLELLELLLELEDEPPPLELPLPEPLHAPWSSQTPEPVTPGISFCVHHFALHVWPP